MNTLKEEFVHDHRQLTRGYLAIAKALKNDNLAKAKSLAEELDKVAGPHIQFEELHLYPRVAENRGDSYAAKLYGEHNEILEAIQKLLQCRELSSVKQQELAHGMQIGLEHAATCGTLLSQLTALPSPVQMQLLEEYQKLKVAGKRWTQLQRTGI